MGPSLFLALFGVVGFTPVECGQEMLSVDSADYVPKAAIITMHRAAICRIRLSKSGDTIPNLRHCPRIKYSVFQFPVQISRGRLRRKV
jgi:hypothetical protein